MKDDESSPASAAWQDVNRYHWNEMSVPCADTNCTKSHWLDGHSVEHARAADAQQIAALKATILELHELHLPLRQQIAALRAENEQFKDNWAGRSSPDAQPAQRVEQSDASVIAAVRAVLWDYLDGRDLGGDRTLVGMVKILGQQRDEARDNRRGEFDLRMKAEAQLTALQAEQAQWQQKRWNPNRGELARAAETVVEIYRGEKHRLGQSLGDAVTRLAALTAQPDGSLPTRQPKT